LIQLQKYYKRHPHGYDKNAGLLRRSLWLAIAVMSSCGLAVNAGKAEDLQRQSVKPIEQVTFENNLPNNLANNLPNNLPNGDRLAQLPMALTPSQLQLRDIGNELNGLALAINGTPQISTLRVNNPDRVILDLQATEVMPKLHNAVLPINRYGIKQVRVAQFQKSPAIARLVFDLDGSEPINWQSSFDQNRGIFLLRPLGGLASPVPAAPTTPTNIAQANPITATVIEGLTFNGYGQLVIQANRPVSYRGSFDNASNIYSFTIPTASISPRLRRPVLGASSPIEQIRLNQSGSTVVVSVKTTAGWQIQETNRTNPLEIPLQLTSVGRVTLPIGRSPNMPIANSPNQPSLSTSNVNGRQLVMIDAGHGGNDVGATRSGNYEKDITLPMSLQLGRFLQQMGYAVAYTRTEDIELDLEPRVAMADNANASVFVSVHVNSLDASSSGVNGVETYHAPGSSLGNSLANLVHQQILASTGANDRGVRSARFYVVTKTSMPAILVETGFITNPTESSKLLNPAYQSRMAEAIARGVDQFLKSYRR
jgi:N-acetylmuramoyl-L-alanine amidase